MTILHKKDEQNIVRTYGSGPITIREAFNSIATLDRISGDSDEIWELFVVKDDVSIGHENGVLSSAHVAKGTIQGKRRGAIALVAKRPEALEMCFRMADMLSGRRVPVVVFENKSAAIAWLNKRREEARDSTTLRRMRGEF